MPCKGMCHRYRAVRPLFPDTRYGVGQKRCNLCEIFMNWEGSFVPAAVTLWGQVLGKLVWRKIWWWLETQRESKLDPALFTYKFINSIFSEQIILSCKGICHKHEAPKPGTSISRYVNGRKRCNPCNIFVSWDGIRCPCCGALFRTKSKGTKARRLRQELMERI